MSYEKRKKNRQNREKRYRRLIIVIGIILFILISFSLFNKRIKTVVAVEDVFLEEIELQGIVIKNETAFKLNSTNDIDTNVIEGKRIPVGIKLGNLSYLKDIDILNKELEEVEKAIIALKSNGEDEFLENIEDDLKEDYRNKVSELQEFVYFEDYYMINKVKEEMSSINKNLEKLPDRKFLGKNLASLNNKRDTIKDKINKDNEFSYSPVAGIFTYNIDGYENKLKPESFHKYTFDKLNIPDEVIDELGIIEKKNDKNGFKIIDNLEWYLALKINNRKDIKEYDIGDDLYVNFPLADESIELHGNIVEINNSSNTAVIILKFNKYLHDLYNSRFPKVKLIQEKSEGLKIPSSVIIKDNGKKGVFIKDFSGIVKFKPIKIISTGEDYTYIEKGTNGVINIGNEGAKGTTISIFDEILLKPYKFKKDQILE